MWEHAYGTDLIGKGFWEEDPPCWCIITTKAKDQYGNRYLRYDMQGSTETPSVPEVRKWYRKRGRDPGNVDPDTENQYNLNNVYSLGKLETHPPQNAFLPSPAPRGARSALVFSVRLPLTTCNRPA